MEMFVWAFLGGLLGAVLMDIAEMIAAKFGIFSGVNVALVGRWFLALLHGQFAHADIRNTAPYPNEVKAGWAFHLLVGGGGVALFYPLFFFVGGVPSHHLLGGALFGLATSVLPWFVLLPSFGWGVFGRRGPGGSNALLASTLSHIPYGLAIGLVLAMRERI